jgi:hypothetical protein
MRNRDADSEVPLSEQPITTVGRGQVGTFGASRILPPFSTRGESTRPSRPPIIRADQYRPCAGGKPYPAAGAWAGDACASRS